MKRTALASSCLLATLLAGCAGGGGMYSEPYALFQAEGRMPAADTRSAFIMKIDGRNVDMGRNDPVKPGTRNVEVSIPGAPGMADSDRDTITVEAKACTRYYFAAKRSSPTARDWKVFISASEPIGECEKRFAGPK